MSRIEKPKGVWRSRKRCDVMLGGSVKKEDGKDRRKKGKDTVVSWYSMYWLGSVERVKSA